MGIVFIALCLIVVLVFCSYVYTRQFSYRKMPPGPLVFPVIGCIPEMLLESRTYKIKDLLEFKSHECFDACTKKYGPIWSCSVGNFTAVIIGSYEILREIENTPEYSAKVCNDLSKVRSMGEELGLIFASSPELWMEMRKFSQRTLRDFGFGKRHSMQSVIEAEITDIVKEMKLEISKSHGILTIRTNFMLSVLNVLWCMIAGTRYAHDDPNLLKMLNKNFAMTKAQTFIDPVLLAFPFLRSWFPKLFKFDLITKVYEESHEYSQSLIDERREEGAYIIEPENYIDCFLKKIVESRENPKTVYTDKNLQMMIEDFMQTGSTTTNGTLNYGLLFLTMNPSIQKRCQDEIDSVVAKHLVPTLDDIEKMPYFQATLLEIHRLSNVVPIPIPRQILSEWNYKGYTIPKGTYIVSNHYSIHMDQKYWNSPETFRPERFLNPEGQFVPDRRVCQFGFGKRYCIGVALANSIIPIYLATLLQNFTFSFDPKSDPPTMEPELGVSLSPKEFKVLVKSR